jgi:hypothetical protein
VIGLVVAVVVLLLMLLLVWRKVRGLDRRFRSITRGAEGASLEAVLHAHLDRLASVAGDLDEVRARMATVEAGGRRALSRVGLVRFNPFEDTGGNQSFALALLDADGNGWVLSSLHARGGTRVYAKAVANGRSETSLSEEETAAIRQATV